MTLSAGEPLRIVHLASLARSGETLVLRALAAHPQVHVVHDLRAENSAADQTLYRLLRVWPLASVPRPHVASLLGAGVLKPGCRVLVLKQGVFAPRHRPAGFALLRNPYAVFCSLWSYDAKRLGQVPTAELNARHWAASRLPRLLVWADASVPGLLPALRAEPDPVRQFLLYWRARLDQILAQQPTRIHYEDLVADPAAALHRICEAAGLPFDPAMLCAERGYARGELGHGGIRLDAAIRPAPAWQPDPLVPLAPFVEAVEAGPVEAWRDLYRHPPALPAVADARAFDEALAAGRSAEAREAWQAMPRPEALDDRMLHMRRGLRLLQAELEPLHRAGQALAEADPLALALEVSLLRKIDPPGHADMVALLARGLDPLAVPAEQLPLALALQALDPERPEQLDRVRPLLDTLSPLALAKLFRHPLLPRNGAVLRALAARVLEGREDLAHATPEAAFALLLLSYAILPPADFDRLLLRLRAAAPEPARSLATRFVLPSEAPVLPRPPARLRIALCVSGQMRGWREAAASWAALGLQRHELSVFVHTWSDLGRRLPDPEIMPSVHRVFADPAFAEAFIRTGQRHGLAALQRAYPRLFAALALDARVEAEALRAVYGPGTQVVIEDEGNPAFAGWDNQTRMHYKIHAAHRLARDSGRTFDLIVRIRPDKLVAAADAPPDWADLAWRSARERIVWTEDGIGLREGLTVGDQFAAGAPEMMVAYAQVWPLQPQAVAEGWPGFPPRFTGHTSLAYTCLYQGLRPRPLPGVRFGPMAEADRIGPERLRQLLAADRPEGPRDALDRLLWQGLPEASNSRVATALIAPR